LIPGNTSLQGSFNLAAAEAQPIAATLITISAVAGTSPAFLGASLSSRLTLTGQTRTADADTVADLIVVWALTGLWHGAAWTFVLWGLYFGVVIGLERSLYGDALARAPRPLQHLYGLLVAVLGWVLFRSTTLHQAGSYYWSMTGLRPDLPRWDPQVGLALDRTWVIAVIGIVLAAGAARPFMDRAERALTRTPAPAPPPAPSATPRSPTGSPTGSAAAREATGTTLTLEPTAERTEPAADQPISTLFAVVIALLVGVLLVVSTAFIVATTYSPFIYFRF